jgi:hypothetical protein
MMSMNCDREQLVSYLYDELSTAEQAAFERHVDGCAACREELAGFRGLRSTLGTWTPPQPELAFQIVDRQQPVRRAWRAWWPPAAGLAAAAVLVLAAASALAHVEFRYGPDGVTVRTGWNTNAPATAAASVVPAAAPSADAQKLDTAYTDIERRIRNLESAWRAAEPRPPVRAVAQVTAASRPSDTEILTRVRDLLSQSESRQQRELALRIAQVLRDVDAQRTADLARIQQGLGRIDAMTNADAAAHRELANYLITSTRQQK